jgi:hypothetical protein
MYRRERVDTRWNAGRSFDVEFALGSANMDVLARIYIARTLLRLSSVKISLVAAMGIIHSRCG